MGVDARRFAEARRLVREGRRATDLLRGKAVSAVKRWRSCEVVIEFADGTRLFVDVRNLEAPALELSIQGGPNPEGNDAVHG